jgi:hypothetical protein
MLYYATLFFAVAIIVQLAKPDRFDVTRLKEAVLSSEPA